MQKTLWDKFLSGWPEKAPMKPSVSRAMTIDDCVDVDPPASSKVHFIASPGVTQGIDIV